MRWLRLKVSSVRIRNSIWPAFINSPLRQPEPIAHQRYSRQNTRLVMSRQVSSVTNRCDYSPLGQEDTGFWQSRTQRPGRAALIGSNRVVTGAPKGKGGRNSRPRQILPVRDNRNWVSVARPPAPPVGRRPSNRSNRPARTSVGDSRGPSPARGQVKACEPGGVLDRGGSASDRGNLAVQVEYPTTDW